MRYVRARVDGDWILEELLERGRRPCSDAFADANDDDFVSIFSECRLLIAAGVPADKTKGNPEVEVWKKPCKGDSQKSTFYVLKAKPSGWRLYFYVPDRNQRKVTFLYAVNKKRNERDQSDFQKLCGLRNKIDRGVAGIDHFYVPDR